MLEIKTKILSLRHLIAETRSPLSWTSPLHKELAVGRLKMQDRKMRDQ